MSCCEAGGEEICHSTAALLSMVKAGRLLSTGGYASDIDASNVWNVNYRCGESPYAEGRPVSYRNL